VAGLARRLNEVLGSQVMYVPAETVFQNSHRAFTAIMGTFLALKEVAQITESDYFQELQKKARTYRQRSPQPDDRALNHLNRLFDAYIKHFTRCHCLFSSWQ